MAEIWYLGIKAESTDSEELRHDVPFKDCLDMFNITHHDWRTEFDKFPELKTGNPIVDESGYVYVAIRVSDDEVDKNIYKPGWYISPLTIVTVEKILATLNK